MERKHWALLTWYVTKESLCYRTINAVYKQHFFKKVLVVCNIFIIFAPKLCNNLNHHLMDALFRKSDRLLANTSMEIVREKMNEIHWNAQLITIMGAKGVGKSTLIRQYMKQNYQPLHSYQAKLFYSLIQKSFQKYYSNKKNQTNANIKSRVKGASFPPLTKSEKNRYYTDFWR